MSFVKFLTLLGLLNCVTLYSTVPTEVLQKFKDHEKQLQNKTYKFVKKKNDETLIFEEKSYFNDATMEKRKITNHNLPDNMIPVKTGIYERFKKVLPSSQNQMVTTFIETANILLCASLLYGLIKLDEKKEDFTIGLDEYEEQLFNNIIRSKITKNPIALMSGAGALASIAKLFLHSTYIVFGEDYKVVPKPKDEDVITKTGIVQFIKTMLWLGY